MSGLSLLAAPLVLVTASAIVACSYDQVPEQVDNGACKKPTGGPQGVLRYPSAGIFHNMRRLRQSPERRVGD
ncbi:MAG TPA: hypothetical protein VEZ48_14815 [Sphingomonadaceae bacterium]|nr:hypothetical protein [Sphingomonadaceae bacterium]